MTDDQNAHPLGARGPWEVTESNVKYQDPWIRVVRDEVRRPDGKQGSYCVAHLKAGVCVIAVDQQQNVYLTQEFHYGVDRVTIEAVSGGRDGDEAPLATAKRELAEELGIEAATWYDLGCTDPFTANVVSPTQLYLAMDLKLGDSRPEGTEQIELVKLPWAEVKKMVFDGIISHSPSGLCFLKADAHLRGEIQFPQV